MDKKRKALFITFMTAVMVLFIVPWLGDIKEVNAAGDVVTRIDLGTTNDINEPFYEYQYVDQPEIFITGIESENGTARISDLELNESERYGWCWYDDVNDFVWYRYAVDGIHDLYYMPGESRFYAEIYVPDDTLGITFANDCEVYVNGISMTEEFRDPSDDDVTFYFSQTAAHISSKDVIEEIDLKFFSRDSWPCADMRVNSYNRVEATRVKLKSGRTADTDLLHFDVVWGAYNTVSNGYDPYTNYNDVFFRGDNRLSVTLNIQSNLVDGYILSDSLKVNIKYNNSYYDMKLDSINSDASAKVSYDTYLSEPIIYIQSWDTNGSSESKVSFDNSTWKASDNKYQTLTTGFDIYAKADTGFEFVEWRKNSYGPDGEVVGTTSHLSVTCDGNATYYAIFRKKLTTGTIGTNASYSFDEGTGTVRIYPTIPGQEAKPYAEYRKSPFYNDPKVKHVIFEEGITELFSYIFLENTIESVEIPASLTNFVYDSFRDCTFCGNEGFTVASGNQKFTTKDGSLIRKGTGTSGDKLCWFYQKDGVTKYEIPEGVTSIQHGCFYGNNLDKLVLKNDGLELDSYAIDDCNIKHFEIEEGVKGLPEHCSYTTEDRYVTLPSTIEGLGHFLYNSAYFNIYVSEDNPKYTSIGGVLFMKKSDGSLSLRKYPDGKYLTTYRVPDGVKEIYGYYSFENKNLKNIIFPESVEKVGGDSIRNMNYISVTFNNPECDIDYNAFSGCKNVTIFGLKGSTAQRFAEQHPYLCTFTVIGDDNGKLKTPQNPAWDGYKATWSEVEGAIRYYVTLYVDYDKDGISDKNYTYEAKDGATEYDLQTEILYNDYEYAFTVKAAAPTYDMSDNSELSAGKTGRFTTDNDLTVSLNDDTLSFPCEDDEGDTCQFYIRINNMSDEYLNYIYVYNSESCNIRDELYSRGYAYGKYKLYVEAHIHSSKTGGKTVIHAATSTPVIYDYEEASPISKIELTIPDPEAGGKTVLKDELNLKTYCGDVILEATKLDSHNGYYYIEKPGYSWYKFDSSGTIARGKYAYAYKLEINIKPAYKFADEVEIIVNGSTENFTYQKYSSCVSLSYEFPVLEVGDIPDQKWTGSEIRPEPAVTFGGKTLTLDEDYELSYESNVNLGTATLKVIGADEYLNTLEKTFKIVYPDPVEGSCGESVAYSLDPYTGKLIISGSGPMTDYGNYKDSPFNDNVFWEKVKEIEIKNGITSIGDCTIPYMENCIKVTLPGTLERIGWAAFQGYKSLTEIVIPTSVKEIAGRAFGSGASDNALVKATYYGTPAQWKEVKVKDENEKLLEILVIDGHTHNYEVTEEVSATCGAAGYKTYTCEACGMHYNEKTEDATGVHTWEVVIQKATPTEDGIYTEKCCECSEEVSTPILKADRCELSEITFTYNGNAQTPGVTVANADEALDASSYDVAYSGNINAGTATVNVTLKGDCYTGNIEKQFTINPASIIDTAVISGIEDKTYTGSEIKQDIKVEMNLAGENTVLTEGTDYTVTYSDNIYAGTAKLTITGKDNFTGSLTKTFSITGGPSKPDATPSPGTEVTPGPGTEVTPSPTPGSEQTVTKPGRVVIKKPKNKKGKKLYVKWKKIKDADGYEVQYSLKKSFSKSKKAKTKLKDVAKTKKTLTIKKLKKKTYYVRVRAYKLDSAGNKVYGKWSKVKKIKIKK